MPADAQIRAGAVTGGQFVRADSLETWRGWTDAGGVQRGDAANARVPWATLALAGLHVRLWTWHPVLWAPWPYAATFDVSSWYEARELWRPLAYGFAHVDLMHLLLNTVWLVAVGAAAERVWGPLAVSVVFLAATLAGALGIAVGTPEVGALGSSGGVFGVIGAVLSFGALRGEAVPSHIRGWFGAAIAPYAVLMILGGLRSDGVANAAHIAGFGAGLLLGLAYDPIVAQRRPSWNARVSLAVGLPCVLFVTAPLWGGAAWMPTRWEQIPGDAGTVSFRVPAGWDRGIDDSGRPAFRSPVTPRSFSVTTGVDASPADGDARLAAWEEGVARRWPDAVPLGPVVDCAIAGRPGRGRAWSGTGSGGHLAHCAAVAGRARLDLTTQEQATGDAVLRRLVASIRWEEPESLRNARARGSPVELATALVDFGHDDEARRTLDPVLARSDAPDAAWEVAARLAENDGDYDVVLSHANRASIAVAAAARAERSGDAPLSLGILRMASARWPRDRVVLRLLGEAGGGPLPDPLAPWTAAEARLAGQARALPSLEGTNP